ncbi:YkvA family protein [uncultured Cetobacterium sp.]|uniref:YkvA family protein n=1 Tax=uncultured Cetobacterium sp. TaxID=527638 RepID=UPI00260A26DD|nr:YkvA family protein [uncultured Cetobacterium sp.]
MNKIIFKFFKKFQGKKITAQDLTNALKKSINLGVYADDLLLIVNLIKDTKNKKYRLEKKHFLILTGAIVYVISPIDAVSDLIPGLGWVDDGILISYVARSYSDVLRDYKEFIKNNKLKEKLEEK